jgi:hypothetical protein
MILATFQAWYGILIAAATAYLFWTAVAEKGRDQAHWLWHKLQPPASTEPPQPKPPLHEPMVVLDHPGGEISLTHPPGQSHRQVSVALPRYKIENKDPGAGIRDVSTGVRTRDGRSHSFEAFRAGMIGPTSSALVENVGSIPPDFLEGVHESAVFDAFLYWARFYREGIRWEVVYDPADRSDSYSILTDGDPPDFVPRARRTPLLAPLGEHAWRVGEVEDVGNAIMQLPVLPVFVGVSNVGDDAAFIDSVDAGGEGMGNATCMPPPTIPAGHEVEIRLDFGWLPSISAGSRMQVTVAYHGRDGRPCTPLVFTGQFMPPARWKIERVAPQG